MSRKTIILDKGAEEIIRRLEKAGYEAYAVGGSVRDALLGRPACDWDITTSALPEEMEKVFEKTFESGIEHGTITVLWHGCSYEVTTYRLDGEYQDHRHPVGVSFTSSLEEDLARRDFTVNAFAYHPAKGLVDCFDGLKDLKKKIIRCVGDPYKRFDEDALRILRALRFAASLNFKIEKNTLLALRQKAPFLADVSRERVEAELNKLLTSRHPEKIKEVFETGVAPYIDRYFETIGTREKSLSALGRALKQTEADRVLRWSVLCRSLSVPEAREMMRDLRFDNQSRTEIEVQLENKDLKAPDTPYEMRVWLNRIGHRAFLRYAALHRVNRRVMTLYESQKDQPVMLKDLAVNGRDLLTVGIPAGKEVGLVLDELMKLVLRDPTKNVREVLLDEALRRMEQVCRKTTETV